METNEVWIHGFSNSIEEVARDAFIAGYGYGSLDNGNYDCDYRDALDKFKRWLMQRRQP